MFEDFFVCTLLFYFFVFLFSSRRIIFEIKNKKEERKVSVDFIIGTWTGGKAKATVFAFARSGVINEKTALLIHFENKFQNFIYCLFFHFTTKRNSQFVASKNASIFGEKEQTSDSVSMFASANKRQERSLRLRRDLIRCFCSRIIFVCTLLFYFFVLLVSSRRIIFEIKK